MVPRWRDRLFFQKFHIAMMAKDAKLSLLPFEDTCLKCYFLKDNNDDVFLRCRYFTPVQLLHCDRGLLPAGFTLSKSLRDYEFFILFLA